MALANVDLATVVLIVESFNPLARDALELPHNESYVISHGAAPAPPPSSSSQSSQDHRSVPHRTVHYGLVD